MAYPFRMPALPSEVYFRMEGERKALNLSQWQYIILALHLLEIAQGVAPDHVAEEVAVVRYRYPAPGNATLVREREQFE